MHYLKKLAETENLVLFLEEYESVTGQSLEILQEGERPDFICQRAADGQIVGVELTKVTRGHPGEKLFDLLVCKQEFMSVEDAILMTQAVGWKKETKRSQPDWSYAQSCILVIEFTDIPLAEVKGFVTPEMMPDLYATGFAEVWVVDFTGLEAFSNVELFCVCPKEWEGYYPRPVVKPYG